MPERVRRQANALRDQLNQSIATAGALGIGWPTSAPTVAAMTTARDNLTTSITDTDTKEDAWKIAGQLKGVRVKAGIDLMKKVDETTDLLYGPGGAEKPLQRCSQPPAVSSHGCLKSGNLEACSSGDGDFGEALTNVENSSPVVGKEKWAARMPRHVGLIPDGNRRWARERGLPVAAGYMHGAQKGLQMIEHCLELGIEEVSLYGFTQDNTKRPRDQRIAFAQACVTFVEAAVKSDIALLVVGDSDSAMFPTELKPFAQERQGHGLKVNMLVNYGWEWDLRAAFVAGKKRLLDGLASHQVSRIDMIVRWGGCRRLSGFLPVQSVYSDFYVVEDYWPDYEFRQFREALSWFQTQEPTLGG